MTDEATAVRSIVDAAGGRLVGKTRLQKTAYLLEICGLGYDFPFTYHYYGPYSDSLATATLDAQVDGLVREVEEIAQWGGPYSIFVSTAKNASIEPDARREAVVREANRVDAVTLELAATCAFLALQGSDDPWAETARRKSQKATRERIDGAKEFWRRLQSLDLPRELPAIA